MQKNKEMTLVVISSRFAVITVPLLLFYFVSCFYIMCLPLFFFYSSPLWYFHYSTQLSHNLFFSSNGWRKDFLWSIWVFIGRRQHSLALVTVTSTSLFSFCIDADFFSLPSVSLYSFKIKQTLSPTYAHHFPAAPACLIIKYVSERVFFIFRRTLVI